MHQVIGIGYEGTDIDAFVSRLRIRGVDVVVDVRLNPISRKRGFSKTALSASLKEAEIEYVHLPQLGNPKDNRDGFSEVSGLAADSARERFELLLELAPASEALDRIVALADEKTVAVLCFEAEDEHCHRQLVLQEVAERRVLATA